MDNLDKLEDIIGIVFKNKSFLREAVTHRSYLNENPGWRFPHNERLEFLGDAVLELAVTEELFKKYPDLSEGLLTVYRAALVNYQMLAEIAYGIKLDRHILMSRGERSDSSRAREVIFANAIEALIGGIYMDQGYSGAKNFVEKFVLSHLPEIIASRAYRDAKSELQEIAQERFKITPTYRVLDESGPAHDRTFRMGVFFGDKFTAEGVGASKQEAEVEAAKKALSGLNL